MRTKTFEYQDAVVTAIYSETESQWTAYVNQLIFDQDPTVLVFDEEPTQDEIDQYLCLELGL